MNENEAMQIAGYAANLAVGHLQQQAQQNATLEQLAREFPEVAADADLQSVSLLQLDRLRRHDQATGRQRHDLERVREALGYARDKFAEAIQAEPRASTRQRPEHGRSLRDTSSMRNRPESAGTDLYTIASEHGRSEDGEGRDGHDYWLERQRKEAVSRIMGDRRRSERR